MQEPYRIDFNSIAWEQDEELARLNATIRIGSSHFHVEAIEVEEEHSSQAVSDELQDRIEGIQSFDDSTDHYSTVEHEGKHYFIVVFPFQQKAQTFKYPSMEHISSDPKIQNILAIAEAIKVVVSYQDALSTLQGFADRIAQLPGQPILRFVEDQDPENRYDLRLFADGNVSDKQEEAIEALRQDLEASGELREIADSVAIVDEGFFDFRLDPKTYKDEITSFAKERIRKSLELITAAEIPTPTEIRNLVSSFLPAA